MEGTETGNYIKLVLSPGISEKVVKTWGPLDASFLGTWHHMVSLPKDPAPRQCPMNGGGPQLPYALLLCIVAELATGFVHVPASRKNPASEARLSDLALRLRSLQTLRNPGFSHRENGGFKGVAEHWCGVFRKARIPTVTAS